MYTYLETLWASFLAEGLVQVHINYKSTVLPGMCHKKVQQTTWLQNLFSLNLLVKYRHKATENWKHSFKCFLLNLVPRAFLYEIQKSPGNDVGSWPLHNGHSGVVADIARWLS